MLKSLTNRCHFVVAIALLALASGCVVQERKVELQGSTPTLPTPQAPERQPTIAASQVEEGAEGWKVTTADAVTLTVTAPGATEVAVLYRPVVADEQDGYLQLKKLTAPSEGAGGKFQTSIRTPADFAGDVWARVTYPDGTHKQTERIALTTREATSEPDSQSAPKEVGATVDTGSAHRTSATGDESARSDKATGGRVVRATLRPNRPDIRITVNVPAFLLTLWQDGREVATYHVGVGRKAFPIPVGERRATRVILNPAWIPPASGWVKGVRPGQVIKASDPRNPLGKVKIPLGDAYLIHQAKGPGDLGNLVSHGCVRMMRAHLYELAEMIVAARSLPVTRKQIANAKVTKNTVVAALEEPVEVDINYDTLVVEGGVLYIYPDVYDRRTNTVARLRDELRTSGVDPSDLDDAELEKMLASVTRRTKFVVPVASIQQGRALADGRTEPLLGTPRPQRRRRTTTASGR